MDLLSNLAIGFQVALSLQNLFYCAVGVSLGTFVGVLPGIGPLATIAMLLPVTFYLPPVTALIMLAGVYYGAMYGGSITSILMNMPGDGASAVVVLDGNPMAKQGRAGPALVSTTFASFFGSCAALVIVGLFAPPLAAWALEFGPAEYFSLMVMGLLAAVMLTRESALKGIAMVLLGLLLGIAGIDVNSGEYRFTFGMQDLSDGINFVVLAMGLFAFGEIVSNLAQRKKGNTETIKYTFRWRDLMLSREDFTRSVLPVFRGTGVGALLGLLPGTGTTIASFIAYSVEKRVARDPSRFGHGAIEGIVAPEAANNAAANTSFIPTLTLGVPGDSVMALMLSRPDDPWHQSRPRRNDGSTAAVLGFAGQHGDRQSAAADLEPADGRHLGAAADHSLPISVSTRDPVHLHRRLQSQKQRVRYLSHRPHRGRRLPFHQTALRARSASAGLHPWSIDGRKFSTFPDHVAR